jgi:collagen type VII alpha
VGGVVAVAEQMGKRRWVERRHLWVVAALMVVGVTTCGLASTAFAASGMMGTMTITPSTGLTGGQTVTVNVPGLTPSSIGNILECNNDPSEPTVTLPSPVSNSLGVGCSSISYSLLATVGSNGTLSHTFSIIQGTVGPPCGTKTDVITTCPATDSATMSPAADAANYPCPPTAAQQAQGVTCVLNYGDEANDSASADIYFQGESTGTTTTAPSATTTTAPKNVTTTTVKTAATGGGTTGTTAASTGGGATGASGGSTDAAGGTTTGSLATTGAGPPLWWMLFVGLMLIMLSGALWLVGPRVWRGRLASHASRSDF